MHDKLLSEEFMQEIMEQIKSAISRSDLESIRELLPLLQPELDRAIREASPFNGLDCFVPEGNIRLSSDAYGSMITVWIDFDRSSRIISGNVFEDAVEDATDVLRELLPDLRPFGSRQHVTIHADFIINPDMLKPYQVEYESEG